VNITSKELAYMTQYVPGVLMFNAFAPPEIERSVIEALTRIDGDDDLLQRLAIWLMCSSDAKIPECLLTLHQDMLHWRHWLDTEGNHAPNSRDRGTAA